MALKEWVPAMRALIDWLDDEDLKSSEALCVRTVGDFTAGMVLHRLLYWMPRGSRGDGGIWKSDRHMNAELGVSYGQMKRAREKLQPLLTMKVKKAEGAPTWHYWVKPEGLLRAISRALMRSFVFVRAWFSRCVTNLQNGFSQNARMDFRRTRESLTTESSTNQTTDSGSDYLISLGVNKAEAAKLAWVPRGVVDEFAKTAATKRTPGGYLLWLLRQYAREHPQPVTLPEETALIPQPPLPDGEGEQGQEELPLYRWEAEPPQVVEPLKPGSPAWAWEASMGQWELQLDRMNFDTWLRDCEFVRFEAPAVFVIRCRNSFARDNLQHRLYRPLCRVLRDVFGSPVEIVFEVREAQAI